MSRSKRSRYLGSWKETAPDPIELPFSVENLAHLLRCGMSPGHPYSHQRIADWARRYAQYLRDADNAAAQGIRPPPETTGADVLNDVDAQWELFLVNTYRLEELQSIDFRSVELRVEWFQDRLARLESA